jgi:hypothetical protein
MSLLVALMRQLLDPHKILSLCSRISDSPILHMMHQRVPELLRSINTELFPYVLLSFLMTTLDCSSHWSDLVFRSHIPFPIMACGIQNKLQALFVRGSFLLFIHIFPAWRYTLLPSILPGYGEAYIFYFSRDCMEWTS